VGVKIVKMMHPKLDDAEHVIEILPEQVPPHEMVGWQVVEDDGPASEPEPEQDEAGPDATGQDDGEQPGENAGDSPAVAAAEAAASTPAATGRGRTRGPRTKAQDADTSSSDITEGV
jgi:hypothetical protein